jgi:hypothetical protein
MAQLNLSDDARNQLRGAVAAVERDLARLSPTTGDPLSGDLHASWSDLVGLLALGPAPETRQCPVCSGIGMRAASRCGFCWAKLQPLAAAPEIQTQLAEPAAIAALDNNDYRVLRQGDAPAMSQG